MFCTKCGSELPPPANFCTRCGTRAVSASAAPAQESFGKKFWRRFAPAVVLQMQQPNAMPQRSGDNFWSSSTASGNDNGSSGYVDVGGTIIGYDR